MTGWAHLVEHLTGKPNFPPVGPQSQTLIRHEKGFKKIGIGIGIADWNLQLNESSKILSKPLYEAHSSQNIQPWEFWPLKSTSVKSCQLH